MTAIMTHASRLLCLLALLGFAAAVLAWMIFWAPELLSQAVIGWYPTREDDEVVW